MTFSILGAQFGAAFDVCWRDLTSASKVARKRAETERKLNRMTQPKRFYELIRQEKDN
jgi:hypothetical protein